MKKIVLLCTGYDERFLIDYINHSPNYELSYILSNKKIENINFLDLNLDNLDKVKPKSDIFIIGKTKQCSEDFIFTIIDDLLKSGKTIYNYHEITYENDFDFQEKSQKYNSKIINMNILNSTMLENKEDLVIENTIPIVFWGNIDDRIDSIEYILGLENSLINKGYNVYSVSDSKYASLVNINEFPFYMFENNKSVNEQAKDFYEKIVTDAKKTNADIIICVMPNMFLNNFNQKGKLTDYQIKNIFYVCNPDYLILSVLNNINERNQLNYITSYVNIKFNVDIDEFFRVNQVSNTFEKSSDLIRVNIKNSSMEINKDINTETIYTNLANNIINRLI